MAGRTAPTASASAVWGTAYIVTTHLLPDGHPLLAALVRSLPAGLLALLITRRLPTPGRAAPRAISEFVALEGRE